MTRQNKCLMLLTCIYDMSCSNTGLDTDYTDRGFHKVCLRSEDAFVMTCVAKLTEVKVLYVQQDLRYEISSYCRFNV
jgi:hypothetical protein